MSTKIDLQFVKSKSPFILGLSRLRRHRLGMAGGFILIGLYFSALLAGFLAPYPLEYESRKKSYHPPIPIHIFDQKGNLSRPFVYNYKLTIGPAYEKRYTPVLEEKYPLKFFYQGEPYQFLGLFKTRLHLFGVDQPAMLYLLGSDWNGRDIFSRLLYGGRISLSVGLIGIGITFFIGMIVGGISGYFGGWIDTVLMRAVELLMSFPSFYLMLSLRAVFPLELSSTQVYLMIVSILSFLAWPGLARVIRGYVLSIREREYIMAAKAQGVSSLVIIIRHALPNTFSYAIVSATLSIPGYILGESGLSLLGLGINEPQASWGNMLVRAMSLSEMAHHPWILAPGFFIFLAIMSFNLLGDGLRDAFDPQSTVHMT